MPMNHGWTVIATIGVTLVGTQALAIDLAGHSRTSRRQVADCMIKRMSADRAISYIGATKACKDQSKTSNDKWVSNIPAKPLYSR
jgi:hypothetical protein